MRHDRTMEQIVFPIPEICEYITTETKSRVYNTAERDDQGSKVSDFFDRHEDMFAEMKWQKKLRGIKTISSPPLTHNFFWQMSLNICHNLSVHLSVRLEYFKQL